MTVAAVTNLQPGERAEQTRAAKGPSSAPASDTAGVKASVSPSFAATVDAAARTGAVAPTTAQASDPRFFHQTSRSGELEPLQKFESFVLRSFIENMMPSEDTAFFGTGTAGKIWKSMLAERIGDEMAASGGIGIADMLAKHGRTAAPEIPAAEGPVVQLDKPGA
ncbi:rod-binding protein [Aureimonas sp. AU12]|uniref:rod-binding protein n=1 Tax=Aureimonas sp. AU12 TaxID=1638161 RepID=UPI00078404F5|nr:rod-binding protein [Aureimonas sp. AU12]